MKDRGLTAVRKSAYDGPEVKAASDELLRARGNADRALENTEAAGQHLNFVCHVAEFLREARIAMTAQCDEILHDALQREVMLLQQDRSFLSQLYLWTPCSFCSRESSCRLMRWCVQAGMPESHGAEKGMRQQRQGRGMPRQPREQVPQVLHRAAQICQLEAFALALCCDEPDRVSEGWNGCRQCRSAGYGGQGRTGRE